MTIRLTGALLLFAAVAALDGRRLKSAGWRTVCVYSAVMTAAVYVGLDFAEARDWPDLHDLADLAFGGAARTIASSFGGS